MQLTKNQSLAMTIEKAFTHVLFAAEHTAQKDINIRSFGGLTIRFLSLPIGILPFLRYNLDDETASQLIPASSSEHLMFQTTENFQDLFQGLS